MTRRALVTGITGQDGYFLSRLLVDKGYEVFGLARDPKGARADRLLDKVPQVTLLKGDVGDAHLLDALGTTQADEVYNLAAYSSVNLSWAHPQQVAQANGMAVLALLNAVQQYSGSDLGRVKVYQASSSEIFGDVRTSPQDEREPLSPRSPYGVAKAMGHLAVGSYRRHAGLFACSGILYNHESEFRGPEFVTRKITLAAARIAQGKQSHLTLGSLEARRDWGFAGDYVEAMWRMLQQKEPSDYVVATGVTHTVAELVEVAFGRVGISRWRDHIVQGAEQNRPHEGAVLCGDATRARELMGWRPTLSFVDLVHRMVDHALDEPDSDVPRA